MSVKPRKTDNPRYVERARAGAKGRWDSAESRNARAEKRINELVALAPPLTESQRAKLAALLASAGGASE